MNSAIHLILNIKKCERGYRKREGKGGGYKMRLVERGKRERRKREKLIFYFGTYMTLLCITLLFYQVYVDMCVYQ